MLSENHSGRGACTTLAPSALAYLTDLCAALPLVSQRPIGRVKRIVFGDIKEIEELEYGEFVLQCSKRDYTFKARKRRIYRFLAPPTRSHARTLARR